MNARAERGLAIAETCKVQREGKVWKVPSQSGVEKCYRVNPNTESCSCMDHIETGERCKHLYAVEFTIKREFHADGSITDTQEVKVTKKVTYRQDWPAYNAAQGREKNRVLELLYDLCRDLEERVITGRGRRPHTVKDSVFAMVLKVYTTFSARRFASDLQDAHEKGFTSANIPSMKVTKFMEDAAFTSILKALIAKSAAPLKTVETQFAIDSSGFGSNKFEKWFDEKYGAPRQRAVWVKAHICCGTRTNIVTAVRILDKDSADSPQFAPLVRETAREFTIGEVSADKAYTSVDNFEAVAACGGTGFMAFKSNTTGAVGGLFQKMFHYFSYKREEYLAHYHRRSNVESVFSMVKAKFGSSVRSKTETAMVNEVLCKFLAHNLCVLNHEECELGIDAMFTRQAPRPELHLSA